MRYIRLGSTGLRVSRICLGMMSYGSSNWRRWVLDEADAEPIVRRGVYAGGTVFDPADIDSLGGSEAITGLLLVRLFPRRDDCVMAAKGYMPMSDRPNDRGLSRKHILSSIDE